MFVCSCECLFVCLCPLNPRACQAFGAVRAFCCPLCACFRFYPAMFGPLGASLAPGLTCQVDDAVLLCFARLGITYLTLEGANIRASDWSDLHLKALADLQVASPSHLLRVSSVAGKIRSLCAGPARLKTGRFHRFQFASHHLPKPSNCPEEHLTTDCAVQSIVHHTFAQLGL